jgi:hypothetical protein
MARGGKHVQADVTKTNPFYLAPGDTPLERFQRNRERIWWYLVKLPARPGSPAATARVAHAVKSPTS